MIVDDFGCRGGGGKDQKGQIHRGTAHGFVFAHIKLEADHKLGDALVDRTCMRRLRAGFEEYDWAQCHHVVLLPWRQLCLAGARWR